MKHKGAIVPLCVLLLMAGSVLLYRRMLHVPPRQAVQEFTKHWLVDKDPKYLEYLSYDLFTHPFVELARHNIITGYQVGSAEWLSSDTARVYVTLTVPEGEVKLPLTLIKGKNHWHIHALPEVRAFAHGVPMRSGRDKEGPYWEIDTGGMVVKAYPAGPGSTLEYGIPIAFHLLNGILIRKSELQPVTLHRVMALSQTHLEDSLLGVFELEGDFPVYLELDGQTQYLGPGQLPIGSQGVTLYRSAEGYSRMAVMDAPFEAFETIRVLLQNSTHTHLLHPDIFISAAEPFFAESPVNGLRFVFDAGEILHFRPEADGTALIHHGQTLAVSKFRWYLRGETGGDLLVRGVTRNHTRHQPGTWYRGRLDIARYNDALALINEVPLEAYLYSVVPSEMPIRFGLEALKAQAVAARSYAVRAMESSGYRIYGAHVDDSTASQVYNNTREQEIAMQAVHETAGLVPFFEDRVVDARFFSTSGGYTANFHEVWSTRDHVFPAQAVPYLTARPQYPGDAPSLYNEVNFRAFIRQQDLPGYDRYSPFFRWETTFTRTQLEAVLEQTLPALQRAQPLFVLTRGTDGHYGRAEIPKPLGTLLHLEVLRRGEGGNMMELEITTTHGTFQVIKEYNIRLALKPINFLPDMGPLILHCHDGSTRSDFPLLPSAFAYLDLIRDQGGSIDSIQIFGGGYGHGVGMSQFGAYGLALTGKSFDQILAHYYPGSELRNIYSYMP